jgi:phenylalanyl-tRNA synthetase beta chain
MVTCASFPNFNKNNGLQTFGLDMQFSESWLRTFCNPPISTMELAETLTMAGLEVEELTPVAPPFAKVVIGEIKEAVQHPNADRLRVCKVDVGAEQLLNIVCGAPNARVGIRVPCALVGAELPPGEDGKPFLIKVGKLRGVESEGMLCSARELKLSEDHGGLLEFPANAPLGGNVRDFLNLDDTLFTLKLTPNLAHCLSVYGVAREVSALTGAPLQMPQFAPVSATNTDVVKVHIAAPDLCGRFSGRVIRNINAKAKTPQWMVDRLARCGQRSVTALVDISNYVMFEFGRPSHIFDLDKIEGDMEVRWGQDGEQLKLLNGNTVTIDESVGVIADHNAVESLAGIMGGDASAVSDDTQNIYVEAAFWWPKSIAGRSRRFNFSTEAGHRFERGVDPANTVEHLEHITRLVSEICGTARTTFGPIDDQAPNVPVAKPVTLRIARASKIIGMPFTQQQCSDALVRLGLAVTQGENAVTVVPPSYRFDLQLEEDLIEEVARMVGYNNLPNTPPQAPITAKIRPEDQRSSFAVRRAMASMGYQETINFSFVEDRWEHELAGNSQPIKLLNPIASQMSVMRSSLLGSLLQVLKFNQSRRATRVRVFEVGRVFLRDPSVKSTDATVEGFNQPMRLAGLVSGSSESLQWGRKDVPADFFDVKGHVESLFAPLQVQFEPGTHPAMHPGRCAKVLMGGNTVGFVGELHPKWRQSYELTAAPILFELDLNAVLQRAVPVFEPVAKFQAVQRDIAVVVKDAVSHEALMAAIWSAPTNGILRDATLFDIYRPKPPKDVSPQDVANDRSLAVRLTLNSNEATLTEDQIDAAVNAIVDQLVVSVGARQRA